MTNHRAPLAPGEIRSHQVGAQKFTVMHVAGGSFTQATVRPSSVPFKVLKTSAYEQEAVNAYADAIEQAESDAIDAMEGDDTPEPLTAESAEALAARAGFAADHVLDSVRALTEGGRIVAHPTTSHSLHTQLAGRVLRAPAPTLADDVAALRAKVGNYGGVIQDWRDGKAPTESEKGSAERFGVFAAWADIEAVLDRIAAREPQRATSVIGWPLWRHDCGNTDHFGLRADPARCLNCGKVGEWRALYVEPDGA